MKNSLLTLIVLVTSTAYLIGQSYNPYARDLVNIVKFFEGEFDNDSQQWFQERRGWPGKEEEKHQRIHATHTKISAPDIGENVFYVEEYSNGNPEEIIRQRIVNFQVDVLAGGIRMQIYFLKDANAFINVQQDDPSKLNGLESSALFGLDGCDVIFKREGDQFVGRMGDKTCQFGEGDKKRYSVHNIILSDNKYWRVDQTYLVSNDEFYKGHPSETPHKMRKVTNYKCTVGFYEKGYYSGSENDKRYENIIIHNQGGMDYFENPLDDKVYGLQLRKKEYPFYTEGADFLMLRFIEKGKDRSTVIITTEPDAKKLSFSLGWSTGMCEILEQ